MYTYVSSLPLTFKATRSRFVKMDYKCQKNGLGVPSALNGFLSLIYKKKNLLLHYFGEEIFECTNLEHQNGAQLKL